MIYCKELDKQFESKEQMFKALKLNEERIIKLKKATIYKSHDKGQFAPALGVLKINDAVKSELAMKDNFIYPIINTTKYMDSHSDVHFDSIWNRSLKNNKEGFFYVEDHELSRKSVIAWPENVKAYVKMLPWKSVGKDFEGETQALIYEINKDDITNKDALETINSGRKVQNSVRMQYVKIKFAVNSNDKDFAENKAYFDSRINEIANKDEVLEQGYFWGVEEAKIIKEGSMVLFGSNDATPILQLNDEPEKSTHDKSDSSKIGTQEKNNLMLNFL